MKVLISLFLTFLLSGHPYSQDLLKLKNTRTLFSGTMIRLDWSSFKFRMNDGAVIEQLTGEIDSVFLSDPTLRTSAKKSRLWPAASSPSP